VNNSEVFNALDLCSRPECIVARITNREDLEGAHEPNHKLVKVRTVVLARQHGRVYTAATKAFARVEEFCIQIAEAFQKPTRGGTEVIREATGLRDTFEESGYETASVTLRGSQPLHRTRSGGLPTCGNCEGPLSFPFWYCIFCQGQSP
jgi:hypothetical protein